MTIVKRLRLLTAVLGCTAVSAVVGTVVFGDVRGRPEATPVRTDPSVPLADETARTKFTNVPTLTYKTPAGETVFAWQVKPALAAQPTRPRDVLVMVDTSASQAGKPLAQARSILTAFAREAGAEDRLDIWTINIDHATATRSLTGGFQAATADAIQKAIAQLEEAEYGSGAVDLKAGLEKAAKQFENRGGRSQVLLYLGDGESAASPSPLTESGRTVLGHMLADREIAFFAVPLGMDVHPHNLHSLTALTGGTVIRTSDPTRPRTEFVNRLKEAFDSPILRPDRCTFGPEGVEVFPTRLPPLRADRPTLVVGKLKAPAQTVSVRVEGRADGNKVTVNLSEQLPEPTTDHYFVASMLAQWRDSTAPDAPAILPADRALALSATQFQLFRDEFNVQAVYAITADRLDHAEKLFQAAARIDPASGEAHAGMRVLERVRGGHLAADKVKIRLGTAGNKIGTALRELSQEPQPPAGGAKGPQPPPPPPGTPPQTPAERDLIAQARAAQQVIEQEFRAIVDETLRRARRLKLEAPDAAYEDLKRARDSVAANDQLSEPVRRRLVQDLEAEMRDVQIRGAEINRQLAAERQRVAQARQRLIEADRLRVEEEQTRARIDQFRQLMQQARFELAQAEAQTMIEERIAQGLPVPPETLAAYRIGQSATHLREHLALKRIRENNWLLTMMQVEKSFIPYPDEPPVHFPPAAVWRQLTGQRVEKYGTYSLGENVPASFRRLRSVLEGEVDKRVNIRNLNALDLQTLLNQLQQEFQEYGVRFVFRTDLLPVDFRPSDIKIKTTSDLSGLPLGAFLDVVLRDTEQGLSWIARPEYIEIGPLMGLRYDEKVTKVFDVADLVIAIPQSVNPQTLYQNLQFVGAGATIFGSAFNPFGGLGGLGQFGVGALGAGALGAGALGVGGGLGALGGVGGLGMGGQLGGPGGGLGMGGQGGVLGAFGQGGGPGGFNGNPLGGLSGQFGIQGNDQSMFLIQLITSVVARGEWDLRSAMVGGQQAFSQDMIDQTESVVEARQRNSLGFYPPARALIVRGSHRYHPTSSFKLRKSDEIMGAGGPGLKRDGRVAGAAPPAGNPGAKDPAGNPPVAVRDPARDATREAVAAVAQKTAGDPKKLWNAAFGGAVTSPALVIDTCDVLFQMSEYQHAAEALKATLRNGRANGGWAHEALAIALQSGQAAPAEVERAALSSVDLEPTDPKAYLKAAQAESDLGRHEVALAFCQRAAALEPNSPGAYVNALEYAERTGDVKSDAVQWASANLLHRDWADDGVDYHAEVRSRVVKIARKLEEGGRKDAAQKLQALLAEPTSRDLVIDLLWQGKRVDLDLTVIEPSGSRCSATHKRTTGGGVLKADVLEQMVDTENDRSETYTAAQAFSGTYTVLVKKALGDTPNGRATIKVTRFQGTPNQTVDLHTVDLSNPQPIQVRLDGGTRTELASIPAEEQLEVLEDTTRSPRTTAPTGINAGVAAGSSTLLTTEGAAKAALPLVNAMREARVEGVAGLPGLRVEAKVAPDRKNLVMTANPVFVGPAKDLPMPKVNLLPGGGE